LRVVPLDLNGDGTITPDENFYETRADLAAAIASRTFPFPPARELYLVTKGKPSPAVAAFLKWVVTDGQKFVAEAGFISLDQETLDAALASLEE
jgi:phosphate transport system substrate-binding protein